MTNREFLSKLTNEEIAHYFETMFCIMCDCENCPLNNHTFVWNGLWT